MNEIIDGISVESILELGAKGFRFVLILALAALLSRIVARLVGELVARLAVDDGRGDSMRALESKKRADTLTNVASRTVTIAIWAVAIVMALSEIGFNVGPLLAGAGVAGIAVGFGAQNLVRDFFAGFFLLTENQIRVGDVAVINGQAGLVEKINLRTTILRDVAGEVHVFPNGAITQLTNKTREYSFYVFDVGVAYKEDIERVMRVMEAVAAELKKDAEIGKMMLEPIQVFGLDKFADSAIVVKARIKTTPNQQWTVGRAYNLRLKKRFDAENIEFPFPHRTVIIRGENQEDELRKLVRDELAKALPQSDKDA
ncbi:MAG: mechanosensitive ion channel family protein [Acidobacteria bacterium]|nr:mechanosensitive ion channel family protein [Acidobacteriota bacterium]MDA1237062.1 mechanosensitive ion channel family protein [Acidobacteriota bacterium]